ncbi:hypothetical protein [Chryseobacterium sp.]|uniref:hypothetical protein n=1 Tax=Chryseobacterium sp. TaxID=1871047 RepID=UPI001AFE8E0A|nr:hypothetical protein [Chryseobacterium sp.]MBO9692169.1 hypothetical protein [Chryseobacterium sp.]
MTTTDIKENIVPYLGETHPYISIPENTVFNGNRIETQISDYDFSNENFSKLIKILSSLGSCNLYRLLNTTSKDPIYFMGEKVRIRQLSYKKSDSASITCESFLESKRKGKSSLLMRDNHSGEALYSFELDYHIIAKDTFKLFYKDYFNDAPIEYYDENLPKGLIVVENEHQFTVLLNPFTPNQCKGHFENYPIVPSVFIMNCTLREIFNFMGNTCTYEIDNLEGFATKAMLTGIEYRIEISHQRFLKDLIFFKCEIKDLMGTPYAIIIVNLRSKDKK